MRPTSSRPTWRWLRPRLPRRRRSSRRHRAPRRCRRRTSRERRPGGIALALAGPCRSPGTSRQLRSIWRWPAPAHPQSRRRSHPRRGLLRRRRPRRAVPTRGHWPPCPSPTTRRRSTAPGCSPEPRRCFRARRSHRQTSSSHRCREPLRCRRCAPRARFRRGRAGAPTAPLPTTTPSRPIWRSMASSDRPRSQSSRRRTAPPPLRRRRSPRR